MGAFRGVELSDLRLQGPRLVLRRWTSVDAPRVEQIMQDPSMHEFLNLPRPYTAEVAFEFVDRLGHEGRDEGTGFGCAVVERATGRVVGSSAVRLGATDPDIGYWIAPDARGHGYAAEVVRLLTDLAFETGLQRMRISCDVTNLASARAAMAAGYRFEGIARADIEYPGDHPDAPARLGDCAHFSRLPTDAPGPVAPAFAELPADGLADGTVRLREIRPDDADELAELDDEVAIAIGFGGPAPDIPQMARLAGLYRLVGTRAALVIEDAATGSVAGALTLRLSGPPGVGGIGYTVHPLFRGRGYTTRALTLLVPWAFAPHENPAHRFARLELGAKVHNPASQRAALNAGFEPDGVWRARLRNVDGTYSDEARFALVHPSLR